LVHGFLLASHACAAGVKNGRLTRIGERFRTRSVRVLDRTVAWEPELRFADATSVVAELRSAANVNEGGAAIALATRQDESARQLRIRQMIALLVIASTAAVIAYVLAVPRSGVMALLSRLAATPTFRGSDP